MADLKETLGHFTLLSCRVRQRNVPKSITQVYSHQYCSLKAQCHDIFAQNCHKFTKWPLNLCNRNSIRRGPKVDLNTEKLCRKT